MQRRDFSRSLLAAGGTAVALSAGLPLSAQAQRVAPKEGTDYTRLARPAPVVSPLTAAITGTGRLSTCLKRW